MSLWKPCNAEEVLRLSRLLINSGEGCGGILVGADGGRNSGAVLCVQRVIDHRPVLQGHLGDDGTHRDDQLATPPAEYNNLYTAD